MEDRIDALAQLIAQHWGARALMLAARRFDRTEGPTRMVWGRIMERLILCAEAGGVCRARPRT